MQVIIPLVESVQDNIELRYALRSVEMYLRGVTSIMVVGHKPNWLTGVKHFPFPQAQNTEFKEKNIYDKLLLHAQGKFLYMNDDHFLLSEYNARKFPYYYHGTLADKLRKTPVRNVYRKTIQNTIKLLNRETYFLDIHCPVIIDGIGSLRIDWNIAFGYCMKTLYSFGMPHPIIPYPDLKLNALFDAQQIRALIKDRLWFSTNEAAWNEQMIEVMEEIYPNKSRYEK